MNRSFPTSEIVGLRLDETHSLLSIPGMLASLAMQRTTKPGQRAPRLLACALVRYGLGEVGTIFRG